MKQRREGPGQGRRVRAGHPQGRRRQVRSTSSASPRRTTGTPWPPSGPCRPARTSTSRSRSATTSAKAGASSRRPASTTASARPARRAAAWPACARPSPSSTPASSARSSVARGLCYKPRGSIGKVNGPQPIPKTVDYDLWCGPAPKKPLHAQAAALRLALVLGLRQRRPRQPGHPRDGHGPLGPGQERAAAVGRQRRRPLRLRRRRRDGQHADLPSSTTATRADLRGARPADQGLTRAPRSATSSTAATATSSAPATTAASPSTNDGKKIKKFNGGERPLRQLRQGRPQRQASRTSTPTSWKATSPAPCATWATSATASAREQPFSKKTKAFGDDKEADETLRADARAPEGQQGAAGRDRTTASAAS